MNPLTTLAASEVQVWRFVLMLEKPMLTACWTLLSAEERQRAGSFHFERDRRRFIARRGILRQILARECRCAIEAIQFVRGAHGKPGLGAGANPRELQFSCSHSGDIGLVAVACGKALGVDLEGHRPLNADLEEVAGCFAPAERAELENSLPEHRTQAFFDLWTCKEAFVKALGLGLSLPLDRFVVSGAAGAAPRLASMEGDATAGARWQVLRLNIGPDCSAALVVEGPPATANCRVWEPSTLSRGS